MMKAVYSDRLLFENAIEHRVFFHFHVVGWRCIQIPLPVVDVGMSIVRNILIKAPTAKNIERLMAKTNTKYWYLAGKRFFQQKKIALIATHSFFAKEWRFFSFVIFWIDVRYAARKNDSIGKFDHSFCIISIGHRWKGNWITARVHNRLHVAAANVIFIVSTMRTKIDQNIWFVVRHRIPHCFSPAGGLSPQDFM